MYQRRRSVEAEEAEEAEEEVYHNIVKRPSVIYHSVFFSRYSIHVLHYSTRLAHSSFPLPHPNQ